MMNNCEQCVVKNKAICSALDADELIAINRLSRKVSIKAGQALIWEGDDSLIVANVVEGAFKLTSSLEDGREQIIGLLYPSDFVGRPFGDKNEYTVTALADSKSAYSLDPILISLFANIQIWSINYCNGR